MSADLVPVTPAEMYTPTRGVMRARHATYVTEGGGIAERIAQRNGEFDRWLAQHDREVAVKTLRKTAGGFTYSAQQGIEPVLNRTVAKILLKVADNVERGEH